jgi:L-threonine-O-3-phosphate decarboxylase
LSRPSHGGNLAWAAALAGCPQSFILDFSASINPLGPPQSAIAAIQSACDRLSAYPDPNYSSLRQHLGNYHHLSADWMLPGNGSAELLTWAVRELAQLEQTILLTPAFGDYGRAMQAFAGSALPCRLQITPPAPATAEAALSLLDSLWTERPLGLLLNNPHNPTGLMFSRDSLCPWLERFALVVVDEAFMDFLPPAEQQSLIDLVPEHENLVVLRSLTKFYSLPGLRLGYAIAHPDRLKRWQQWRDPWPVNALAEAATEAILTDTQFQQRTWDWLPAARQQLFEGLSALPGLTPWPGAANFLLVECQPSVLQVQAELLKQDQVLIRDCHSFPELGDRYFRVAVRTEAENQRLLTALAKIL